MVEAGITGEFTLSMNQVKENGDQTINQHAQPLQSADLLGHKTSFVSSTSYYILSPSLNHSKF